jgi:hypothetical protein
MAVAATRGGVSDLLEREPLLEALREAFADARDGRGGVVLVAGEAGVGKTIVLGRFCDEVRTFARVLWGDCDALFTPRPLGPFADIARVTGDRFRELVDGHAKPHAVAGWLLEELEAAAPSVVVLEDVHWADEATLDVLRIVGRRIRSVPALLVVSYRDDELDRSHPLRSVLGELPSRGLVRRLCVSCLSREAVAALAEPVGVDPDELFARTGGNPFFVTEVLGAGVTDVPDTIRDAVLARTGGLDAPARALLDAVAIFPRGPSCGCSRLSRRRLATGSRRACGPACSGRSRVRSRSGTSLRGSSSRSRSRRTRRSRCTGARSPRSLSRRLASRT